MPLVSSSWSCLLKTPNKASILRAIGSFISSVYRVIVDAALRTSRHVGRQEHHRQHHRRRLSRCFRMHQWHQLTKCISKEFCLQFCFEKLARPFLRVLRGLRVIYIFFQSTNSMKLFIFELPLGGGSATEVSNNSLYNRRSPGQFQNLWVFSKKGYGLWIIEDLWVMVCKSLPIKLVDKKNYGI
jgi:hypothetical protein